MSKATIYKWVRELLQKTDRAMPDSRLEKWADSAFAKLRDEWSDLPAYDSLDADDVAPMDEALGFLVAAKMRPFLGKSVPVGEIVRIHTQNTHYEYGRPKQPEETVEQYWARCAFGALKRVSVIGAVYTTLRAIPLFQAAGPRTGQQARGVNTHNLANPLFTILADEWDYQIQHPGWWYGWLPTNI